MSTQDDIAISVNNVSKTFKLPHEKQTSLKGVFLSSFSHKNYEMQQAIKNVSFEIKTGEFFGIVGRNGSGKSTLLKMLAGIYVPDTGHIKINGSLVPFIELGVGFNPELSGKDNIFLNGAILGFNRKQMNSMYDEIVEFAELEQFMDQKLKNYSSGMQVRLAFSIAIRAKGDILLLDEVLAVGDAAFQQKCFDYFDSIKSENRTIILVSHSMPMIERFCDRAMFLEKSTIKHIGESAEIARMYEDMFLDEELIKRTDARKSVQKSKQVYKDETVQIHSVKTFQGQRSSIELKAGEKFELKIELESREDVKNARIGMNIKNRRGLVMVAADSDSLGPVSFQKNQRYIVSFLIDNVLTNDLYTVTLSCSELVGTTSRSLTMARQVHNFTIHGIKKYTDSLAHPDYQVTMDKHSGH